MTELTAFTRVPWPLPFRVAVTHWFPRSMQYWHGRVSSQRLLCVLHSSQRSFMSFGPRGKWTHSSERATQREHGRRSSHCRLQRANGTMGSAQSASSHLDVNDAPFCYLCGSSSTLAWLDRPRAMSPIYWTQTLPCTARLRMARTRAGRASPTQGSRYTPAPAPRILGTAFPPRNVRARADTHHSPRCTAPRGTPSCGSRRTVWKAAADRHRRSHSRMRSPD